MTELEETLAAEFVFDVELVNFGICLFGLIKMVELLAVELKLVAVVNELSRWLHVPCCMMVLSVLKQTPELPLSPWVSRTTLV